MPSAGRRICSHRLLAVACFPLLASFGFAQTTHVPIYRAERSFKPSDVHARLAAPSPFEFLLKHVAKNPEQMKALLGAASRAQKLLGDDKKFPLKPEQMDKSLSELARRYASDPKLREQIQNDPAFQKIAADLRQKLPKSFLDSMRDRLGAQPPLEGPATANDDRPDSQAAPEPSTERNPTTTNQPDNDSTPPSLSERNFHQKPSPPDRSFGGRSEPSLEKQSTASQVMPIQPGGQIPKILRDPGLAGSSPVVTQFKPPTLGGNPEATSSNPVEGQSAQGDVGAQTFRPATTDGKSASDGFLQAARSLQKMDGPLGESQALRETIHQLQTGRIATGKGNSTSTNAVRNITAGANRLQNALSEIPESARGASRWGQSMTTGVQKWLPSAPKLPAIPKVSLPRMNVRLPNLRLPKLPATPKLGIPVDALTNSGIFWGTGVLSLVGVAVVLGLLFRQQAFLPRLRPSARRLEEFSVSDRTSLRKSFENVAFYLLGESIRFRHHRAIANDLATSHPESAAAAKEYADLYEQARYAPPHEQLSEQELLLARESYTRLAKNRPI